MIIDNPCDQDVPSLRALWQQAFGDGDEFLDGFFSDIFSTDMAMCAKNDGKMLSMLYIFDCEFNDRRLAYLYAVATSKEHRGRGICHELMKKTHERLAERGYDGAILVPGSKDLFSFYEGMGYRTVCGIQEMRIRASGASAHMHRLTKEEYALKRREFLPDGGVLQEGKNLDFLELHYDFYVGDDFLLVGAVRGDALYCPELLGNTAAAPKIACALGAESGVFRAPGNKMPFAMYKALRDGAEAPTHFAFAFD